MLWIVVAMLKFLHSALGAEACGITWHEFVVKAGMLQAIPATSSVGFYKNFTNVGIL